VKDGKREDGRWKKDEGREDSAESDLWGMYKSN